MSLYGSMRTGVSGMNAQSNRLGTVAENIANANTTGYKRASTEFSSMILPSGGGNYNSGGVETQVRYSISQQGATTYTTSDSDLAIDGGGFFIVQSASGENLLTRAGSFVQDKDGKLINTSGFKLMGYEYSSNQDPTVVVNGYDGLREINIEGGGLSATGSTAGALDVNLPSGASVGFSKSTSLVAYDTQGNTCLIDFKYTKTSANEWVVDATYNGTSVLAHPAQPSTNAVLSGNLDASAAVGTTHLTHSDFYASDGSLQTVDILYEMTPAGWEFTVSHAGTPLFSDQLHANEFDASGNYLDPEPMDIPEIDLGGGVMLGPGTLVLNGLTSVSGPSTIDLEFDGSAAGSTIELKFDAKGQLLWPKSLTTGSVATNGALLNSLHIDIDGTTQVGADFTVANGDVNGNSVSKVSGFEISDEGIVSLRYDNGDLDPRYRIALANVQSPDKLRPETGNVYSQGTDSGVVVMGYPKSGEMGRIISRALEGSNVDIANELTSMIESQRNYTANSKVFQTASDLLDVLVNLKR